MASRALLTLIAMIGVMAVPTAPAAQAAGAPQLLDSWATGVTASAVDVHASVNPNEAETRGKVEYLTADAYRANLEAIPARDGFVGAIVSPVGGVPLGAGSVVVELTRHIAALKSNTAYRYRVVVSSSEGTVSGPARTLVTQEAAVASPLLDGRGWEMVSPADKNGGEIQAAGGNFGGGVLQAGAGGDSVTYSSSASFADAQGAPGASQYLSSRTSGGWATANITVPTLSGAYGAKPDGVPYQLFSPDLARGLLLIPQRCETEPCPRHYSLLQSSGALTASPEATDVAFAGASADLAQLVLSTQGNLYRWSGGPLIAVNLKPGDSSPTPGATLGAQAGAVSGDGSRVYFQLEGNLYLRQGTQTFQVDEAQGGGGSFQTATADGAVAFFTKAGHLYRYAAGGTATDLTPAGEVQGVLGISLDASYLYYLTPAGLYLRQGATTTKVADAADAANYPPATGAARVAANGNLAFVSTTALTNADAGGFTAVYLYAPATQALACVSCNPSGARPLGPSSIPGAIANGKGGSATRAYKPRALSAGAGRLFFDSRDALVASDTNNDWDVYEWEAAGVGSCARAGGCVALISSGRAEGGASFLDASADGSDAFFVTDGSLVPTDPGASDVYDARVGGGFPVPPTPIPCIGDACQVVPGEPEDPSPGTAFYRPEGNPPLSHPKAKPKKKHAKHHKKKASKKRSGARKGGRR